MTCKTLQTEPGSEKKCKQRVRIQSMQTPELNANRMNENT